MILNRYGEESVYRADDGNTRPGYAYGTMVYVKRMISKDTLFLSALRLQLCLVTRVRRYMRATGLCRSTLAVRLLEIEGSVAKRCVVYYMW